MFVLLEVLRFVMCLTLVPVCVSLVCVSLVCVFTERLTKCDSLPSNSSR